MQMTEVEMADLGRSRFSLQLERILSDDLGARPKVLLGFEAANAAASMENSLSYEDRSAYHMGINYALEAWLAAPNDLVKD
jgi:hypothetical protein